MTNSNGPQTYTPEQRDFVREVYAGADQAGAQIAGLATVQRVEDAEVGKIDNPVKIGQTGTVTVRVGKDGELLPPRGHSDQAATSVLHIDVHADLVWDSNGDAHVRYIAYAKQIDTRTARYIDISRSGPSSAEWQEQMGGRPDHEAFNDPATKDWVVGEMADTVTEAVRQAVEPLVGAPNQLVTGQLQPPPAAAPVVPATPNHAPATSTSAFPWWMTAVGSLVVLALIAAVAFWLFGTSSSNEATGVASDDVVVEQDDVDAAEELEEPTETPEPSAEAAPADEPPAGAATDDAQVEPTEEDEPSEAEPDEAEVAPPPEPSEEATAATEATRTDECSNGAALDGGTPGLDPFLTLTGYQLLVDLATAELWLLLCFTQPWTLSTPPGLWSFAYAAIIEILHGSGHGFATAPPEDIAFNLYEFHDGVWTVATETAAGPTESTMMITENGNSLIRSGLTVQPDFEGRMFIQTASTPSATDEVSRFEVQASISGQDAVFGSIEELVTVVDVDPHAFPGIDPDGFGPETAAAVN